MIDKSFLVIPFQILIKGNVRGSCDNMDPPPFLVPTDATSQLQDQLKHPFFISVVRKGDGLIRFQGDTQGNISEIMTFGDHLRSDQDIPFTIVEMRNGFPAGVTTVLVKSFNPRFREQYFQPVLYLLGRQSFFGQEGPSTVRAEVSGFGAIPA